MSRKCLGSTSESHAKSVRGFLTSAAFQIKRAEAAMSRGACLPAGKAIDHAYEAIGAARGHRQGMESQYEHGDVDIGKTKARLLKVDAKFESTCVRHKPVTALNGRK